MNYTFKRGVFMKKRFFALLMSALILLLAFTSCSKTDDKEDPNNEDPVSSSELSDAGRTAKISFQIDDKNGHNEVKIPIFSSDTSSAAIDELNTEIETLVAFYNEANSNKLKWPLIYTEVYENDRYLQAVVEYQAYPDIEGASVVTYVYDKVNDAAVSVEDAYLLEKTSETQLKNSVTKARCIDGGFISGFEVQGVYIDDSGSCQFFVKYELDNGADAVYELATYVPESKTFLGEATASDSGLTVRIDE